MTNAAASSNFTRATLHSLSARHQYAPLGATAAATTTIKTAADFESETTSANRKRWLIALATAAVVGLFVTTGTLIGGLVKSEL